MKIYHHPEEFIKTNKPIVVTSGTFDGVHCGHQKIINRLKETAQRQNGETLLLTYWPHPRLIIHPAKKFQLLSTLNEKKRLLETAGIDHLVIVPFTKQFSQLTSEEFIQNILVEQIGTSKLVIGYDHRFGRNREGGFEHLQKNSHRYGFEVEEIPAQDIDETTVSSTKIRQALAQGQIQTANSYLGSPYSLTGKVVKGQEIGHQIGYPTANIDLPEKYKLIPADGVYAVEVWLEGQKLTGMMNIGSRPTIAGAGRALEVHIFNFDRNIYADNLTVKFIKYLRAEQTFSGLEELKNQLKKDEEAARAVFS